MQLGVDSPAEASGELAKVVSARAAHRAKDVKLREPTSPLHARNSLGSEIASA